MHTSGTAALPTVRPARVAQLHRQREADVAQADDAREGGLAVKLAHEWSEIVRLSSHSGSEAPGDTS